MILSEAFGSSESQGLPIPGQLEVAAPVLLLPQPRAHRAFPVDGAGARARVELLVLHERLDLQRHGTCLHAHRNRIFGSCPGRAPAPEDRKSTRLNSSHSSISYAVFCLKKKKKTISIFTLIKKKKKIIKN